MAGVVLSKQFAKRVNAAVKRVEAMERSGHAFRRNPAPSYFGGALTPAFVTGSTLIRPNVWRYRARKRTFNTETESPNAFLPEDLEFDCYNWREQNNAATGEQGVGVPVGTVGGATITLKPIRTGCPILVWRAGTPKPQVLNNDPVVIPTDTDVAYIFEADNAPNVSCGP